MYFVFNLCVFQMEEWPFQWICEALMNSLFHSAWEIRHGAATGLREIIKIHGGGAGKTNDTPTNQVPRASYESRLVYEILMIQSAKR